MASFQWHDEALNGISRDVINHLKIENKILKVENSQLKAMNRREGGSSDSEVDAVIAEV